MSTSVNHLPECWCAGRCPTYEGATCPCRDCICDELRACEQRVLEAAIAAVREAIGEEWRGEIVPKGEYDCCGCSSYNGIVNDATDAIDALRGSGNLDTPPSAEKGEQA